MSTLVVLVAVLASSTLVTASHNAVLPASIIPSKVLPAEHAYVVSVYVGTPPEELTLEVRFDAAGVWIFRDQAIHSASHVTTNGAESDIVYFGGQRRRIPTQHGVPPTLTSVRLCGDCGGVLGLRSDSVVWRWWPDAAFTPASVTLGGRSPPLLFPRDDRYTWELPCENADTDEGALCVVAAEWEGEPLRVVIMPHAEHTVAPRHIVKRYLEGKNLYDDYSDWEPFTLVFTGAAIRDNGAPLVLALDREDLSGQHGAEASELLIDVGTANDTVVVGMALLKRFAIYRAADRSKVVLHAHTLFTNLPRVNSILFFFVFCFYVRWKSTDLGRHYARAPKRAVVTVVDFVYQISGWVFAVVALFLPATRAVMVDTPTLHTAATVVVFVGIAIELVARLFLHRIQVDALRTGRSLAQVRPHTFLVLVLEAVWHEAVLITAMWILVAPRRREGLVGPLTAVAGAAAVYSFTRAIYILSVFAIVRFTGVAQQQKQQRRRQRPSLALLAFVYASVGGLAAFFGVLFFWVFALPTIVNMAGIYAELAYAVAGATVTLVVLMGVGMADAYIEQAVYLSAKQYNDALMAKEGRLEYAATIGQRAKPQ